jgi:hypothetical protein
MRECPDGVVKRDATMVNDFLQLGDDSGRIGRVGRVIGLA